MIRVIHESTETALTDATGAGDSLWLERGVSPMSVGQVIVATWHPHENDVLEVIRDLKDAKK